MSEEGTVGDAVQTAVADGFSEMAGEDRRVVVKVGDGAGHAQDAVAGAGGHVELLQCVQRQSES